MSTQREQPTEIGGRGLVPAHLAPCFQEYALAELNLQTDRDLIIERVLTYGNREEVRWLLDQYGRPYVSAWIRSGSARRLPRSRHRLWSVLLNGTDIAPPSEAQSRTAIWPH